MAYKDFITTRTKNVKVKPSLVTQPVVGREAEMIPSSGGAAFAFQASEVQQYKRWLVFGSTGSTMYASAKDLTIQNLDVVKSMLDKNYLLPIDIALDFSKRNVVKGHTTLLTVLSMALSYNTNTIRLFPSVNLASSKSEENLIDSLITNGQYITLNFKEDVHRVGFGANNTLYVMVYDSKTGSNYQFYSVNIKTGETTLLKNKPQDISWKEHGMTWDAEVNAYIMAVNYGLAAKQYAAKAAYEINRQSSMLFESISNIDVQRGWGPIVHKIVENFYLGLSNTDLAQQLIKYGNRQGWSHKDLLRKVKPITTHTSKRARGLNGQPLVMSQVLKKENLWVHEPVAVPDEERSKLFAWAVDKFDAFESVTPSTEKDERGYIKDPLSKIWAADALTHAKDAKEVAQIVYDYQMPREAVERANTKWLKTPVVWEALLDKMPGVAMVRNLRNMAEVGLLTPLSDAEKLISSRLANTKFMGRVHPIQIMQAAVGYDASIMSLSKAGSEQRSRKGESTKPYIVSQVVMNALNTALSNSYSNVVPTNKNFMTAIDISGSMYWHLLENFFPFYPGEAAAMMALIWAQIEPYYFSTVFATDIQPINISKNSSIGDVLRELNKFGMGRTNIELPVKYAMDNNIKVDAFISITDGQVNSGNHVFQTIRQYRDKMGIPAKFIMVAMEADKLTVADPKDPLMLDVVGCSADTQSIVSNYIRGEF